MRLLKFLVIGLIVIYLGIIFYYTLYDRNVMPNYIYKIVPFWSYGEIVRGNYYLLYLNAMNILMFIPLGGMIRYVNKEFNNNNAVLISGALSFIIELSQLISKRGTFEFDDIIHNVIGSVIGVYLCIKMMSFYGCNQAKLR